MKTQNKLDGLGRRMMAATVIGAALAGVATPALAQRQPMAPAGPDERLMSELAGRNMDQLLNYYATKNHVPPQMLEQAQISKYLTVLVSPGFAKLKPLEKQKIIDGVVGGIEKQLGSIKDPALMMKIAAALIESPTMQSLVNTIEYWGENAHAQAQLHQIAAAVDALLSKDVALWKQKEDALLATNPGPNDPRFATGGLYDQIEQQIRIATYTQARSSYALALSLDKAAAEERTKICDAAIEVLKPFDDPDSGVQVAVRGDMAKLNMVKGDSKEADHYFDLIINDAKAPIADQYQARYFKAVNALLTHQLDDAKKLYDDLVAWQKDKLPKDAASQQGADAAASMLSYRITAALTDAATDPAAKEKLKAQSVAILLDLMTKQPSLRSIIFGQLAQNLPEDKNYKKWDLITLEALVQRGIEAAQREKPEKDDAKWLDRATDGGREIVARKGQPGNTPDTVDNAAFDIGVLEEKLSRITSTTDKEQMGNTQDAAEAFLDYVEKFGADKDRVNSALDQAISLIVFRLRANPRWKDDDRSYKLYDRMLQLAVARGRVELNYALGQRLMTRLLYKSAAEAFSKVPKNPKPIVDLMACFYQMLCEKSRLTDPEEKLLDADKAAISTHVRALADQVLQMLPAVEAADPDMKSRLQEVRVQTMLIAADLARGNKNYARVLELLQGAEDKIAGLPEKDAQGMMGEVLQLRVTALMGTNKTTEAIATLRDLVKSKGKDAFNTIAVLTDRVNQHYIEAKQSNDTVAEKQLADERAELAKLLVEQLKSDPTNPHRKDYLLFNARAQVDAALLSTDEAQKQEYLKEAMATFQDLLKDNPDDAKLIYDTGNVYFAQKDWRQAASVFGNLFQERRVGKPIDVEIGLDGQPAEKPNANYWDVYYKYMRSEVEWAKQNPAESKDVMPKVQQNMKDMIIQWGDDMGFAQKENLKALREEVIPGWKPSAASQPATKPGK